MTMAAHHPATTYVGRLYDFLTRLAANNDRQWFADHKREYDELRALWMADLDRIIAAMTEWEPAMASQSARTAAYRIYRDVRFSTDKSPYKTYFSAAFSPLGRKTDHAGYYLEMSPLPEHQAGLYGGVWCMERPVLNKLRHAIVDNIDEWTAIVDAPDMRRLFPDWCSSMLKTVPRGWAKDHPQALYLRMTNYGKFHPAGPDFFADPAWPERAAEIFHTLKPLCDFIDYTIDE